MEAAESKDSGHVIMKTHLLLLGDDDIISSYGSGACSSGILDTPPTQKHRFRLWTVSFSCIVAIQTWFIYGYAIGYTAPVLNDLGTLTDSNSSQRYTSLRKTSYQDTFSVSILWSILLLH